jgi:hypothetical protein
VLTSPSDKFSLEDEFKSSTQALAPYVLTLRICEKKLFTLEAQRKKNQRRKGLSESVA